MDADPSGHREGIGTIPSGARRRLGMGFAIELEGLAQTGIGELGGIGAFPHEGLIQSAIEVPPDRHAVGRSRHWRPLAQFAFPLLLSFTQLVGPVLQGFLGVLEGEIGLHELRSLLGRRHGQTRGWVVGADAVEPLLGHIVEKGVELVELLGADGVVLVVVAFGATHGQPHEGRPQRVDPIHHVFVEVFVGIGTALVVGHVVAHESRGHALGHRGVGQQVAGQLLDGELIEGFVGIEGVDHPVAPQPHEPHAIEMVTAGVGIAGQIEPVLAEAFTVMPGFHEAIHQALVGVGTLVSEESIDLFHGGRQSGEVEGDAPLQADRVGLRVGLDAFRFQTGQHKGVDGVAGPLAILDPRQFRRGWSDERPVLLPSGSLTHPLLEEVDLGGGERLSMLGRRHDFVGILRQDALDQGAALGLSGDQGVLPRFELQEGVFLTVQAQTCLALALIWSMAGEAMLGENGADLSVEVDGRRRTFLRAGFQRRGPKPQKHPPSESEQTIPEGTVRNSQTEGHRANHGPACSLQQPRIKSTHSPFNHRRRWRPTTAATLSEGPDGKVPGPRHSKAHGRRCAPHRCRP